MDKFKMATRSTIALEFADGTVHQVYCNFDGYLAHNGQILSQNYMDPFVVCELIDLGDFSSLRESVEGTREGAYAERGEDCSARRYMDVTEYFAECQQEEYDYILRQVDGVATWFVRFYATEGEFVTFEEARLKEQEHA